MTKQGGKIFFLAGVMGVCWCGWGCCAEGGGPTDAPEETAQESRRVGTLEAGTSGGAASMVDVEVLRTFMLAHVPGFDPQTHQGHVEDQFSRAWDEQIGLVDGFRYGSRVDFLEACWRELTFCITYMQAGGTVHAHDMIASLAHRVQSMFDYLSFVPVPEGARMPEVVRSLGGVLFVGTEDTIQLRAASSAL